MVQGKLMPAFRSGMFGWRRDLPDPRDYYRDHPSVRAAFGELKKGPQVTPKNMDWAKYFSPVEDSQQEKLSTSCACVALAGYFERHATGRRSDGSRLFLFQNARKLSGEAGKCGVDLRTTLKALARFGLPPERYGPSDPSRIEDEPEPFLYAYGRDYESLVYVRLDPIGSAGASVLGNVKTYLAAGFPSVFGFPAFDSLTREADVPFPTRFESVLGGSAAVAVGYDDARRIRSTKGALRVRMCWGEDWGEGGYGWLPYAYVEQGLAVDFWSLLRPDWLASGEFLRPVQI
jgi:C1A family cysteine protease